MLESPVPFTLPFYWDSWQEVSERAAVEGALGLWLVAFEVSELHRHAKLNFTRRLEKG